MEEYLLKVVIIGSSKVGKTALLVRYDEDTFSDSHICTIGVDFRVKTISRNDKIAKIQLWDTAGQERFRNIVSLFYRGAEGIVIVFDVTDADSFNKVPSWLAEATLEDQGDCIKILVGNKIDLPNRVIDKKTAQAFADKHGIQYIETSAKTASNVHLVFDLMADAILERKIEFGHPSLATNTMEHSFIISSKDTSNTGWCYWGTGSC
uniref:SOCS box domain-containing protein n=1 Tax=Arion vulgaris TaxID=1028688 RepID=A0A0B7A6X8_9EUPU